MEIVQNNKILQRFLLGFLLVVLVATPFFSSINHTEAQVPSDAEIDALIQKATAGSVNAPFVTDEQLTRDLSQPANKPANNPTNVAAVAPKPGDISWLDKLGNTIGTIVLNIASSITWLGGKILEWSIDKLVLNMGMMINESGMGGVINQAWTTVRDICNLAFIFGFIYIGIRTIIDGDSANTKRFLASIIMGAVLINFSLYFTKIVIDVSNYISVEIVAAMKDGTASISQGFAEILRVQTLFTTPGDNAASLAGLTKGGNFSYFIMGAIFLIVAGFVLAAGGFLLIIRFVQLVFIMVFSPILFAATVFPKTEQYAEKLWSQLFSQAFFAPVYLFMLLISMRLLQGAMSALKIAENKKDFSDALAGMYTDSFDIVLMFIISIMFLIISLKAAQQMGAVGADKALAFGKSIRGQAQSAIGRNTIGRLGEWTSRKQQEARESNSKGRQFGAALLRGTGINSAATAGANAKWGGSTSRVDAKKENKEVDRARAKNAQVTRISDAVKAGTSAPADARGDNARIAMESALAGASTEQILALLDNHKAGTIEHSAIIGNLSSSQFDSVMKSKPEDLDDKKKENLRTVRATAVENRLIENENRKRAAGVAPGAPAPAAATIEDVMGKADGKDLDALGYNTVYENAGVLTSKQIDDMSSLTPTSKARLKEKRSRDLIDLYHSAGSASARAVFDNFKDVEAAKLPKEILVDPGAAEYLNVNILNKILDNDGLTAADRTTIKTNVQGYHAGRPTSGTFTNFFNSALGSRY